MSSAPWNVPESWSWAEVREIGRVVSGGTPSTKEPSFWGDEIVWFSPADLTGYRAKYIARGTKGLSLKGLAKSSAQLMPQGAVMFSSRAPIGYVAITAVEAATNQGFKSVLLEPGMFNEYLYYYLKAAKQLAEERATGTTFKEISGGAFAKLPVPIPPANEQRRIVAKIEELFSELDKGVESLVTAREQLKAYRQSILKSAFEGRLTREWRQCQPKLPSATDVIANALAKKNAPKYKRKSRVLRANLNSVRPIVPDEWGTIALGDLDVEVFDGPFGSHLKSSDYLESGVRVIRLENIGHGHFIEEKRSYVSPEKYQALKRHTVFPGDIVVSSFVTDTIRSAIVPASVPVSINKADCFAVRLRGDAVMANFVQRFLEARCAYKQVEDMIHGVGRPRINTTQLKQVVLPVCSRAEQFEVLKVLSTAYSNIFTLDADLIVQIEKIRALRQSILRRAFSGQLVAQDPADEPASALLDRIRAERDKCGTTKRRAKRNVKKEAA
ncbi:MAG TPA: restriction endonuclease subunit S [Hyphomonas sp.]|nr:restriction endonuclease subunit S [Hyphomonas sp.]